MHRSFPATWEHFPHSLPENKIVPFGWRVLPVPKDENGLVLQWEPEEIREDFSLRFTLAVDLRAARAVEVCLAQSGYRLGLADVQFGCPFQTFEVLLPKNSGNAILSEGLRLRLLDGDEPLWIFGGETPPREGRELLLPHLFTAGNLPDDECLERSFETLTSLASVQIFGWMEGCVLEGLEELASLPGWRERALRTLNAHLNLYFPGNAMIYVSPHSELTENQWINNEQGLMLPALLRHRPEHPAIQQMEESWLPYFGAQTRTLSRNLSCEACYTVAYPFALIASAKRDEVILDLALDILLQHQTYLARDGGIYLAWNYESQTNIYPNWLRGIAWYLLGHCRVLQLAREYSNPKTASVIAEIRRVSEWIVTLQGPDGLWYCFAHEPETGVETSGSAGIAAGLVLAHRLGCADEQVMVAARKCLKGLEQYLSPDGLLHGVSQSNKAEAGEPLQRNGFRGYSQIGQGMAVQLAALLQK